MFTETFLIFVALSIHVEASASKVRIGLWNLLICGKEKSERGGPGKFNREIKKTWIFQSGVQDNFVSLYVLVETFSKTYIFPQQHLLKNCPTFQHF